jgi:hypothetical protein
VLYVLVIGELILVVGSKGWMVERREGESKMRAGRGRWKPGRILLVQIALLRNKKKRIQSLLSSGPCCAF